MANLGAVHSDLLQMQQRLKGAMDQALITGQAELSDIEFILSGLDHQLRLARQIDRFSHLELQLKNVERKLSAAQGHPAKLRNTPDASTERSPASEE